MKTFLRLLQASLVCNKHAFGRNGSWNACLTHISLSELHVEYWHNLSKMNIHPASGNLNLSHI